MFFSIFCPHLYPACAMFWIYGTTYDRYMYVYIQNPAFDHRYDSLVWGSLRLAPIIIIGTSDASPTLVVKTENCPYVYLYPRLENIKIVKGCRDGMPKSTYANKVGMI